MTYLEKLREVLPEEILPKSFSGARYCKQRYFKGIRLVDCCANCRDCFLQEWQGEKIREDL